MKSAEVGTPSDTELQVRRTIFEQVPSEGEAAFAISRFLDAAFAESYIIGYLKCQYIDRPSGFGRGLRQGLLKVDGTERKTIVNAYAKVFTELIRIEKHRGQ